MKSKKFCGCQAASLVPNSLHFAAANRWKASTLCQHSSNVCLTELGEEGYVKVKCRVLLVDNSFPKEETLMKTTARRILFFCAPA